MENRTERFVKFGEAMEKMNRMNRPNYTGKEIDTLVRVGILPAPQIIKVQIWPESVIEDFLNEHPNRDEFVDIFEQTLYGRDDE